MLSLCERWLWLTFNGGKWWKHIRVGIDEERLSTGVVAASEASSQCFSIFQIDKRLKQFVHGHNGTATAS